MSGSPRLAPGQIVPDPIAPDPIAQDPIAPASDHDQRRDRWSGSVAEARAAAGAPSPRYVGNVVRALRGAVPQGWRVLQVQCGAGDVLAGLRPSRGVGVEPSAALVAEARRRHPGLRFEQGGVDAAPAEEFDAIVAADVLPDCFDVDELLEDLKRRARRETRLVFVNYSQAWRPILRLVRALRIGRPRFGDTWFTPEDFRAACARRGIEVIRESPETLLPVAIPLLSTLANRFLARLPLLKLLCLHLVVVARVAGRPMTPPPSVTVVVPARNEAGNVRRILREIPRMGEFTEVIFVEGNSTDDTYGELVRLVAEADDPLVRLLKQPGRGKGDAVRTGFAEARGDVLMILDADLTMPAEMLPRFHEVIASGHCEFANGSRLVYRMDDEAMQFLNLLANRFFAWAFSAVLGQRVKDTLCGTKVLSRRAYEQIAAGRAYFGDFDPFGDFDLLFGAARLGLRIADVPIRYRERTYGETNIRRFAHGWLLFRMLWIGARKLKFR